MKENKTLEYKEKISNTFLKTVSAYANYGTGVIKFGINDQGKAIGISNPKQACLDIENKINDVIKPSVEYTLDIDSKTNVIKLCIMEGIHKPYLYNGKAYKRNDTSTVEVDHLELTRLVLEGENITYEELLSKNQKLEFSYLDEELKKHLNLSVINHDTYKSLELMNKNGMFNHAAALLADKNTFPGVEVVRFGKTVKTILDRNTFEHESILQQYHHTIKMFETYYQYEEIRGAYREQVDRIPKEAFREAIANALVHRTWDVKANITVFMFEDRIEITSPGGLVSGVTEEAYLKGGISILRNHIIGNLFLRFHMMERLGTGIVKINEEYKNHAKKPVFEIYENMIKIILPVLDIEHLSEDENIIYQTLNNRHLPSSSIVEEAGFGKTKTVDILNKLVEEGYIVATGSGRGKKYKVKK